MFFSGEITNNGFWVGNGDKGFFCSSHHYGNLGQLGYRDWELGIGIGGVAVRKAAGDTFAWIRLHIWLRAGDECWLGLGLWF